MADSAIEWTDKVWNPVTGCTKVSQGCKHCYAERLFSRPYPGRNFSDVQCHTERLNQPLHWRKHRRVFVNSMSDLFHEAVPDHFIDQVFAVMALCQWHTFQLLTKRPERMRHYLTGYADGGRHVWTAGQKIEMPRGREKPDTGWPLPNVWLGVSVEDQATADERIPLLLRTSAALRFVSAEPVLGPIELPWLQHGVLDSDYYEVLDWAIAGGESGPKARPMHPDWVRSLRDQCKTARVPFFFTQWGAWAPNVAPCSTPDSARLEWLDENNYAIRVGKNRAGRQLDGRTWDEFPEMPR